MPTPFYGGLCAGRNLGDWLARGYVTIDAVSACTLTFPGDAGYFVSGGSGTASDANVLWGDYYYVDADQSYAQGETLVHIEASPTSPETTIPGQYTFYGRYDGWTAADNREPLSTQFASRFATGGPFDGGTSLIVWRDSKVSQGAVPCDGAPAWYPLGQEGVVVFDEQENPESVETTPISPQPPGQQLTPFPVETQRVVVGGSDLPVTATVGWLYLDLNTTVTAAGAVPPEDPAAAQAWVTTTIDASGRFSVGYDAIRLDSACGASHTVPGAPTQN